MLIHDAGSSAYFKEGIVSYTNEAKHRLLHVSKDTLSKYGAVSEQTAGEMGPRCQGKLRCRLCAFYHGDCRGPDGAVGGKPVGTVWIGLETETMYLLRNLSSLPIVLEIGKELYAMH